MMVEMWTPLYRGINGRDAQPKNAFLILCFEPIPNQATLATSNPLLRRTGDDPVRRVR